MVKRGWLVGLAVLVLAGCQQVASPHVSGAGYGVGISRETLVFGRTASERGSTQGVDAPTERGVGKILRAPSESYPMAGKLPARN
jgi:hypothetical protein